MSLTDTAAAVLASLRLSYESTETRPDGTRWGCVYLDNARDGMKPHLFAGYLSALEREGLYHREGDPDYAGQFGWVLL